MLRQSSHDHDFYNTSKVQKYIDCGNVMKHDRLVPKQVFLTGRHIPILIVANHRTPDPRLNPTSGMSSFLALPFYDTNIGNIMKQTTAMNIVQSYEMQSTLLTGDVFIDIGANLGSYTVPIASHVGPLGTVIAFEPFRWLYQLLNANVAMNGLMNVWAYQVALSDVPQRLELLQPNLRNFASPGATRFNQTTDVLGQQTYDQEWGTETVDAWRLDDVVFGDRGRKNGADLIKIDVEGMELAVMIGAVRTLTEFRPIVWVENVDWFERGDRAFLNWMESVGYVCWKSLSAGNDLVCEPKDGSRTDRLARVRKVAL